MEQIQGPMTPPPQGPPPQGPTVPPPRQTSPPASTRPSGRWGNTLTAIAAGLIGALVILLVMPAIFGVNPYDLVRGKVKKLETLEEVSLPKQVTNVVSPTQGTADVSGIASAVIPAIVNITVRLTSSASSAAQGATEGIGSGMIYTQDGNIITNNHVVEGAQSITVTLADGQNVPAKKVGSDAEFDVAVIKIAKTGLPVLAMGDSGNLAVGQLVVAVGSPLGFEQTVTSGIISALHRNVPEGNPNSPNTNVLTDMIQTDAPINPGNSGGALCDSGAKAIGMNTLIASQSGGSVGIGFASPINQVKHVADDIIAGRSVDHPYIGVTGQTVDPAVASQFKLPTNNGGYITDVTPGGPADKAGIKPGDIIVAANGKSIATMEDLFGVIRVQPVGTKLTLDYFEGSQKKTTTVTVADKPANVAGQ
ncbi:MAG TPA: trypsin-like peptidase domain-containing protein [Candidatus Anoxymicrobiaceae bacterium]